tara:strand:- start:1072 stop:1710 length:639 start_codon:yes stop_codon:yes gene_type:complete
VTDYAKIALTGTYSKSSSYSPAKVYLDPDPFALRPDEYMHFEVQADTGGTTLSLSHLASISAVVIKNNDTTNGVRAVWHNARGSASYANLLTFADAATGDTITEDGGGTNFTASSIDVVAGGYVRLTGATDAANNATFLVSSTTDTAITLATSETLTARDDTATVIINSQEKNSQKISAGGFLVVSDIVPEEGLTLTADSSAVECEVLIFGT